MSHLCFDAEKSCSKMSLLGRQIAGPPKTTRPLSYWKEETSFVAPVGRSTPTSGLGETGFRSLLDART